MSIKDPRLLTGLRQQLAGRDHAVDAGARQIGWKLGFGTAASMQKFDLGQPLVGYLLDSGLVDDGAEVSLAAWANPVLEPEVAVHLGSDVDPGASYDDVRAAIAGVSVAIELADLSPAPAQPGDVADILAGNIFHRHVLLGPVVAGRPSSAGLGASVTVDGAEVAATSDASELTGDLVELARQMVEQLGVVGERLRAGHVVITGSVVSPLPVAAGQRIVVDIADVGRLSVVLAG